MRAEVRRLARKTKADSRFTQGLLQAVERGEVSAEDAIKELATYRFEDLPFVIEGVETEYQHTFLQNRWPDKYKESGMQGWIIQLQEPLNAFFESAHPATPDQPRGYRLKDSIRDLLR